MKPGRNQPCPCGSGLKFKHCCGAAGGEARQPIPPAGTFQRALSYHQGGHLAEAESLYRQLLEAVPNHADTLHLLGVVTGQQGDIRQAISLIQQAIKIKPRFADAYNNLGNFLLSDGNLDGAIESFHTALDINPAYPEAYNNLGNALRAHDKSLAEVVRCYQNALDIQPNYAEAHVNLGLAYFAQGRVDEAIAHYRQAIATRPKFADAYHDLGLALQFTGQHEDAMSAYQAALALRPNHAETHNNLGNLLRAKGQLEQAVASFRHALNLRPNYPEALCNLAQALHDQNLFHEAIDQYREALKIDPACVEAHYGLGYLFHQHGQFADAAAEYQETIRVHPTHAEAYSGLVRCKRVATSDTAVLDQMESLLINSNSLSESDAISLHGALGKAYDDLGEYPRAMDHFVQGNQLQKAKCPFDRNHHAARITELIKRFNREYLSTSAEYGESSDVPVLIVGMPRSGTTLVEQILSSHHKVGAGGELGFWADQELILWPNPAIMPEPDTERAVAKAYVEHLKSLALGASRVTDKLTTNFLRLGLIHKLLPHARIIHCRRHPLDTCLSVFFTRFAGKHCYSHDLEDLTSYYEHYQRLMAHWRELLPGNVFYEVDYEQLVTRTEETSRALVAFCGLEWDPSCLNFTANKRAVRTASKWQVRQPIFTTSMDRWRHYQPYLGPLGRLIDMQ
jgi:tetratricopeptide (TPR) repeat protein